MIRLNLRRETSLPLVAVAALLVWAWRRLGFFDTSNLVVAPDGSAERWPNALAAVDHPFHAARFGLFLDAVRDGRLPHWVFSHQGGYPAEFYPFGSSLIDLGVWVVTLGQLSIPMVHTWSVALVFALPALGFLAIARWSGLSLWVAALALACHLCVRGWWWSGGSYELIEWGLVTNVLAATLIFLAMIAIALSMSGSSRQWLVVAAGLIAWAGFTNPRSLIAVIAIALAALVVRSMQPGDRQLALGWISVPFALGIPASAPILMPLIRYNDLYYFVHYSGYADLGAWFDSSVRAVSGPVFVVSVAGLLLALIPGTSVVEQMIGWTVIIYAGLTAYLVIVDWPGRWTEQLETTRLMPFQRLLMISLAAIAVGRLAFWMAPRRQAAVGAGFSVLLPMLFVLWPPDFIPASDRGLVRVGTMAEPGIADLRTAVELADSNANPDTALLILGTTAYWHDHMWSSLWSDRLLFYDDWLWYWQREHVGEYEPESEHAYPRDSSTINEEYLATHGIGAVVVTGEARESAASAPFLTRVRSGVYDVFVVEDPTTLATVNSANVDSMIVNETISVSGLDSGGTVVVRENWFPRWQATVDGIAHPMTHRADGYMEVTVPPGSTNLTLSYERTPADWIAVMASALAGVFALALLIRARPTARSEPR